jgi:hypothetical protein
MGHQWNEIDRGKPTTRRKPCPSATLSTTNSTWTDPGSNPGLRSERPATNRLSHGTAYITRIRTDLANFNPQEGHIIRKDSPEGCSYVYI